MASFRLGFKKIYKLIPSKADFLVHSLAYLNLDSIPKNANLSYVCLRACENRSLLIMVIVKAAHF